MKKSKGELISVSYPLIYRRKNGCCSERERAAFCFVFCRLVTRNIANVKIKKWKKVTEFGPPFFISKFAACVFVFFVDPSVYSIIIYGYCRPPVSLFFFTLPTTCVAYQKHVFLYITLQTLTIDLLNQHNYKILLKI